MTAESGSSRLRRGQVQGAHVPERYRDIVRPHVESFDHFIGEGIRQVLQDLEPVRVPVPSLDTVWEIWLANAKVGQPVLEDDGRGTRAMHPRHCREMGATYRGKLSMDVCVRVAGSTADPCVFSKPFGSLPIMLQSRKCHLRGRNRDQLVKMKEEPDEFGGVFICNGIERIIRMLVQQRRHFVMALNRSAYGKRGTNYTPYATLIRCVRPDQSSATVRLHYLKDGTVNFAFTINRAEYFLPVVLLFRALRERRRLSGMQVTDRELYDRIVAGAPAGDGEAGGHESFVADRAEMALRAAALLRRRSRREVLTYLGDHFRVALPGTLDSDSAEDVGRRLLRHCVFVHLSDDDAKFALLLEMLHKLYALANLQCCEDNPDGLTYHEILLPGQLLAKFFKEQVETALAEFAEHVKRDCAKSPEKVKLDLAYLKAAGERLGEVGKRFEYLLNTGNLASRSGLDLSQAAGFTVVAEKLNFFRYLSHFRSVHRGAYFMELRTTAVRKLLPESFGFLCPVHTPDGSPCGLLNHLAHRCNVVAEGVPEGAAAAVLELLARAGMAPAAPATPPPRLPEHVPVTLDGAVVGYLAAARVPAVLARLRAVKAANLKAARTGLCDGAAVPYHTEACYLPFERGGPYPGVFVQTQQARMARLVRQTASRQLEYIGSLEQLNMHIRCPDGGAGGTPGLRFTHEEVDTSSMLSEVANVTPFSDFNQSPRNMYQCQMGKQTMGTPATAYEQRTDGKLYRIHTPQKPLARTRQYDALCMDEYPQGTNMVVCVVAYTGYDMEDAMILNKSAVERGLAHGSIYKTETIDLKAAKGARMAFGPEEQTPERHRKEVAHRIAHPPEGAFGGSLPRNLYPAGGRGLRDDACHRDSDRIDVDGMPMVGAAVWPGETFCNTVPADGSGRSKPQVLKGEEQAVVQRVALLGEPKSVRGAGIARANVCLRLSRTPVIGDKFASRAGQKGVLGAQWPDVDMPFCARTGMRPDLLINPHAFPSRMTIGMLLESMASKAGALEGKFVDASSFQKCDNKDGAFASDPIGYVGEQLERHGYARHGQEVMINGYTGEEMPCDIFIGCVYYQRLRHMVKDKFQVRSTGKNNPLTRQPIKGRKVGGGIRFGEMERDSLLAHGASYLLHDRLHYCSDYHVVDVCTTCGSMLTLRHRRSAAERLLGGGAAVAVGRGDGAEGQVECERCGEGKGRTERIAMPYVLKYLVSELAVMNIKVTMDVT